MLRMWEQMCGGQDLDLLVATRAGKRGLHWDFKDRKSPSSGMELLPPFDDPNVAVREILNPDIASGDYWGGTGAVPDIVNRFRPKEEVEFRLTHTAPRYGMGDLFLKVDAVPSAGQYMDALRTRQKTAFAEIIRGDKPLSYFEQFVRDWYAHGGQQLTAEADELYKALKRIYREIGVDHE
jgi:putative aldouronate transport system substrate-binding protein